nr:metallophosphoesterase [Caldalkalibacillus salinus]
MGDLHYSDIDETIEGLSDARRAFYQTFIARFLSIDANLHISLGDLTNYGYSTEFEGILQELQKKKRDFVHVLGNHDLYAQPRENVLRITEQPRYHARTTDQAVFAFLDTAKEMDHKDWGGWIDEEQLRWFERVVRDSGTKPLLVFAHHPVHATTKRSEMIKGSIHPDIDMWDILGQKEGLGVYFNGHTHIESIEQQRNWTFVQLAACLDEPAFRVVDIQQEDIVVSAVDVCDDDVVKHAPMIYEHIPHFTHQTDVRGEKQDRECRISLTSMMDIARDK